MWLLLPECGTTPLRFDSEAEARRHLRTHYPDRRFAYKDPLGELYRIPLGGFIHVWQEEGSDDAPAG